MRQEFRGNLPADCPDPMTVTWEGCCEHQPDDRSCLCLVVRGQATFRSKFLCPHSDAADDDMTAIGASVPMNAAECDRLIETLQRARRETFGPPPPRAVTMEVVERGREVPENGTGSLILPNEVSINGTPVYTIGGIKVHEMDLEIPKGMASVTVTLPVRLLVVGAENDTARPAAR